jgi:hypothetical protein
MKTLLLPFFVLFCLSCKQEPDTFQKQKAHVFQEDCKTDTIYKADDEEFRYRNPPDSLISWEALCKQLNRAKLHSDTIGEFQSDTSGTYVYPDEMRHTLSTSFGLIEITYLNKKLIVRKNGIPAKITAADDEEITNYNLNPYGSVIQYSSGGEHYVVFDNYFTHSNGSGVSFCYHFIMNLTENTVFVISGRDIGLFPLFACDYNADRVIDFMFPHYVQHQWTLYFVTDTTESFHFIPYNETTKGEIKPILKPNGDTTFFRSFVHFEYGMDEPRIWSSSKEGQGIAFKKSPLIE